MSIEPSEESIRAVTAEWARLLASLIPDIRDDYRASDDPDDDTPGMQVTFGITVAEDGSLSWGYQTGDNSFAGGAYCHPAWGICYLYRDSDPARVAQEAMDDALANL